MNLFFDPEFTERSAQLSAEESYHLQTVLRKNPGDQIHVTNGKGWLFHCRINSFLKKHCQLSVMDSVFQSKTEPETHLYISVLKTSERMEWLVEKATEIGVAGIHFFISSRTERKQINLNKLNHIAIAAIKQSGRSWLPEIAEPTPYLKILQGNQQGKFIASLYGTDTPELKNCCSGVTSSIVLIGPEGDFTEEEMNQAIQYGFKPVSLGKFTLRAETAGLIAVQTLMSRSA